MAHLSTALIGGIAAVALTQIASAADLPRKAPAYAPPPPPPVFSWSGCYVGINGGGHWGRDKVTTTANPVGWIAADGPLAPGAIDSATPGTVEPTGGTVGGQVGCNWQMGGFVFGIEGDANWVGGDDSRSVTNFTVINSADVFTTSAENRFFGTFRPRIGWAWDRVLLYATGGLAVASLRFNDSFGSFGNTSIASVSTSDTRVGWTVGGGVEWAFANNWSAKFEYLYADFGTQDTVIPSCVGCAPGSDITVHHKYTDNFVRVGLNYKFTPWR